MSSATASTSQQPLMGLIKSENEALAGASPESGNIQAKTRRRRLGVDPSLIISEDRSKRRRTPSPEADDDDKDAVHDPQDAQTVKHLGMQIFQKIMDSKDSK